MEYSFEQARSYFEIRNRTGFMLKTWIPTDTRAFTEKVKGGKGKAIETLEEVIQDLRRKAKSKTVEGSDSDIPFYVVRIDETKLRIND